MKIAVINFSGNVGKSTVSRHLLAPRLGADVIAIESINADEGSDVRLKGGEFKTLQELLFQIDDVIVDIGTSNVETFLLLMGQFKGSHEEFDYFIIPCLPGGKQDEDTVNTLEALRALGVPSKKVRMIFNMVELGSKVDEEFAAVFDHIEAEKTAPTPSEATAIIKSEVFKMAREVGKTVGEINDDKTDWRAMIRTASNDEEKKLFTTMTLAKRLAASASANLDAVYKALNLK